MDDATIAEVVANVALNIFTNYFNHVAETEWIFRRRLHSLLNRNLVAPRHLLFHTLVIDSKIPSTSNKVIVMNSVSRCARPSIWKRQWRKFAPPRNVWNSRDPHRVSLSYTEDSVWRNRDIFLRGRAEIIEFLSNKWVREHDYRLVKELWAFGDNRIAVRFQYEWHDDHSQWFRSYGNELWEFESNGSCDAARRASMT